MLFLIISCALILATSLLLGLTMLQSIRDKSFNRLGDRIIVSVWVGLIINAVLMLLLSLFLPLSHWFVIVVEAVVITVAILIPGVREEISSLLKALTIKDGFIVFVILTIVAAYMSQPIICIDTGFYHLQSIKWLSQYGVVPGLALLHHRLGYVSAWFAMAAPFHQGILTPRASTVMPAVGLCLVLFHSVILAKRFIQGRGKVSFEDGFITIAYLLCIHYAIGVHIAISPSPDIPIIFLTIIVAWATIVVSKYGRDSSGGLRFDSRIIPLLLAAGAVTVKLNAIPLLLVTYLFYVFDKGFYFKRVFSGAIIVSVVIFPLLITNVIISGCPLFPSSSTCLNVPWSIGTEQADRAAEFVRIFARWRQYSPPDGATGWFFPWVKMNGDSLVFLAGSVFSTGVLLRDRKVLVSDGRCWVMIAAIIGIVFVFYVAPWNRFGLGYLIILPALLAHKYPKVVYPLALLVPQLLDAGLFDRPLRLLLFVVALITYLVILLIRGKSWVRPIALAFVAVSALILLRAIVLAGSKNVIENRGNVSLWLVPPEVIKPDSNKMSDEQANDVKYKRVSQEDLNDLKGLCWNTDLPCTPGLEVKNIRFRDPVRGWSAGIIRAD